MENDSNGGNVGLLLFTKQQHFLYLHLYLYLYFFLYLYLYLRVSSSFRFPGFDSYLMRATASFEGLAMAFEV